MLSNPRKVHPGEVEHELAHDELFSPEEIVWTPKLLQNCDAIFERFVQPKTGEVILNPNFCDLPKWVFLEFVIRFRATLLQGCKAPNLNCLQPVLVSKNLVGWNTRRHIAFPSSTIAMADAILDGARLSDLDCTSRSTVTYPLVAAETLPTKFYFGVDYRAVSSAPWSPGMVYLYDSRDFPNDVWETPFFTQHPIRPMARLSVLPQDWPMLETVEGVDLVAQTRRQWDTFKGYPWHHDDEIHPHRWKRPLVEDSKRFLADHFAEPITLDQLGKRVGLNSFAMLRTFQAGVGLSPAEALSELRISKAKQAMRAGKPIGQAVVESGFCDQTHLNRHLRRRHGITAGQYVRMQDNPRSATLPSDTL